MRTPLIIVFVSLFISASNLALACENALFENLRQRFQIEGGGRLFHLYDNDRGKKPIGVIKRRNGRFRSAEFLIDEEISEKYRAIDRGLLPAGLASGNIYLRVDTAVDLLNKIPRRKKILRSAETIQNLDTSVDGKVVLIRTDQRYLVISLASGELVDSFQWSDPKELEVERMALMGLHYLVDLYLRLFYEVDSLIKPKA